MILHIEKNNTSGPFPLKDIKHNFNLINIVKLFGKQPFQHRMYAIIKNSAWGLLRSDNIYEWRGDGLHYINLPL